jgi:hypothetical protein
VVLQLVDWGRKLIAPYRKNYHVTKSCKGPWTWILWKIDEVRLKKGGVELDYALFYDNWNADHH